MRQGILVILFISISAILYAQKGIDEILLEISSNNNELKALREQTEAGKLGNRTGLMPTDPGVELNYLWGDPAVIGNRTDFAVVQEFDFPTSYVYRNRIAETRNEQLELQYLQQKRNILHEAQVVMIRLTGLNVLNEEYQMRLKHAEAMANSYQRRFEEGESSLPDLNKAQLNLANARRALDMNEIERRKLLSELTFMNGGIPVDFNNNIFDPVPIPADFDDWFDYNASSIPFLQWQGKEVEASREQEKLNRSLALPGMHAGYMSETVGAEKFSGITAGITIPLWENRNMVKQARANTTAMEMVEQNNRLRLYSNLRSEYERAIALEETVTIYRESLMQYDNRPLMNRALELRDISVTEYLMELSIYYESVEMLVTAETELQIAIAELYRYL